VVAAAAQAEEALDEPEDGVFPPAEEDLDDYEIETEEMGQAEYVTEAFHTEEEPASDAFLVDLERSPPVSRVALLPLLAQGDFVPDAIIQTFPECSPSVPSRV
jgi:hypothetical protein